MRYFLFLCMLPLLTAAAPDLPGVRPIEKDKIPDGVIPDGLAPKTEDEAAERVAVVFADAFLEGKPGPLAKLGTDPFSFGGRQVKGTASIEREWKEVYKRAGKSLPGSDDMQLEIVDYKTVTGRFGKPPAKYKDIKLKKCFFAIVRFAKRSGLMLILTKDKKAGWIVTAVSD